MVRLVLALTCVLVLLGAVGASAAPIHLVATGGLLRMGTSTPAPFSDIEVQLTGPGFSLTNDLLRSDFRPNTSAYSTLHPVGTLLDLSGHVNVIDGSSTVLVLDGIASEVAGRIDLFLPLVPASATPLSVPFTLTGDLQGAGLIATLTGGGLATIAFSGGADLGVQSVRFAVIPEPSTLALGVFGLAALLTSIRIGLAKRQR